MADRLTLPTSRHRDDVVVDMIYATLHDCIESIARNTWLTNGYRDRPMDDVCPVRRKTYSEVIAEDTRRITTKWRLLFDAVSLHPNGMRAEFLRDMVRQDVLAYEASMRNSNAAQLADQVLADFDARLAAHLALAPASQPEPDAEPDTSLLPPIEWTEEQLAAIGATVEALTEPADGESLALFAIDTDVIEAAKAPRLLWNHEITKALQDCGYHVAMLPSSRGIKRFALADRRLKSGQTAGDHPGTTCATG